jgi:hypothetical protein
MHHRSAVPRPSLFAWECSGDSDQLWYWAATEAVLFSTLGVSLLVTYWMETCTFTNHRNTPMKIDGLRAYSIRLFRAFKLLNLSQLVLIVGIVFCYAARVWLYQTDNDVAVSNVSACRLAAISPLFFWLSALLRSFFEFNSYFPMLLPSLSTITHLLAMGISGIRLSVLYVKNASNSLTIHQINFAAYVGALALQAVLLLLDFLVIQRRRTFFISEFSTNPADEEEEEDYLRIN